MRCGCGLFSGSSSRAGGGGTAPVAERHQVQVEEQEKKSAIFKRITTGGRFKDSVEKMLGEVEERLAEEVRRYPNLYDSSSKHYKDNKLATNSWKEISERTGLQSAEEAAKKWKNLRDKYVRLQRKMVPASSRAGSKKTPALVIILSWLAPHIRHRDMASRCDAKVSFKFNFTLLIPLG